MSLSKRPLHPVLLSWELVPGETLCAIIINTQRTTCGVYCCCWCCCCCICGCFPNRAAPLHCNTIQYDKPENEQEQRNFLRDSRPRFTWLRSSHIICVSCSTCTFLSLSAFYLYLLSEGTLMSCSNQRFSGETEPLSLAYSQLFRKTR